MLEATILSVIIVLCLTILVHSRMNQQVVETIVEKTVYKEIVPIGLLKLAGAIPADNGGWFVQMMYKSQLVELWYIDGAWRLHDTNLLSRTSDKWIKIGDQKVYALLEVCTPVHQQQMAAPQQQKQQQLSAPTTGTYVDANGHTHWPMQKDNNGKRIPNVSSAQAEAWYTDDNHGWGYDPVNHGLWLPDGYNIRKDKTPNSPTFGMFIVDRKQQNP